MKLILVGFGKMGQALFQGWRKQSPAPDCLIIDPFAENAPDGATLYKNAEDIPADYQADVIVFAVKPQVMGEIVPAYRRFTSDTTLFISIAAGKTLATLESLLSPPAPLSASCPTPLPPPERALALPAAITMCAMAKSRLRWI